MSCIPSPPPSCHLCVSGCCLPCCQPTPEPFFREHCTRPSFCRACEKFEPEVGVFAATKLTQPPLEVRQVWLSLTVLEKRRRSRALFSQKEDPGRELFLLQEAVPISEHINGHQSRYRRGQICGLQTTATEVFINTHHLSRFPLES